jgi:hypothetical protein
VAARWPFPGSAARGISREWLGVTTCPGLEATMPGSPSIRCRRPVHLDQAESEPNQPSLCAGRGTELRPVPGRCKASALSLAAQARKYGLGMIFASQRPKGIRIVSNCTTHVYGRMIAPATIEASRELMAAKGGAADDIGRLTPCLSVCLTTHFIPGNGRTLLSCLVRRSEIFVIFGEYAFVFFKGCSHACQSL